MERNRAKSSEVKFQSGQLVKLGNPRWFEYDERSSHKGIVPAEESILVLRMVSEEGFTYSRWTVYKVYRVICIHDGTIGTIKLFDWIDEVVK